MFGDSKIILKMKYKSRILINMTDDRKVIFHIVDVVKHTYKLRQVIN